MALPAPLSATELLEAASSRFACSQFPNLGLGQKKTGDYQYAVGDQRVVAMCSRDLLRVRGSVCACLPERRDSMPPRKAVAYERTIADAPGG
jgi:hypothetical protein